MPSHQTHVSRVQPDDAEPRAATRGARMHGSPPLHPLLPPAACGSTFGARSMGIEFIRLQHSPDISSLRSRATLPVHLAVLSHAQLALKINWYRTGEKGAINSFVLARQCSYRARAQIHRTRSSVDTSIAEGQVAQVVDRRPTTQPHAATSDQLHACCGQRPAARQQRPC